jgi:hypothetical protein
LSLRRWKSDMVVPRNVKSWLSARWIKR